MMKTLCVLLLSASAFVVKADEPQVRPQSHSREALAAKQTLDAILLFEDGETRLKAHKYGTSALAFQTLITVYPDSPLVAQATEGLRAAERHEAQQLHARVVRALRFENLSGIGLADVLQRFEEREIDLGVEKTCDTRMVEQAKTALAELLTEKGVTNPRVQVSTHDVSQGRVEITFKVTHTSRIGSLLSWLPGV